MLPIAPSSIRFSRHAQERYAERARAGTLTPDQAHAELQRIARHGTVETTAPPWAADYHDHRLWLVVGDVAFPIERGPLHINAITCVTRGLIEPRDRHIRTQAHRKRRQVRAGRRQRDARRRPKTMPTIGEFA